MALNDQFKTTEEFAKDILGCLLVHETEKGMISGWIVEAEAYVGIEDQACHSYLGKKTPRLMSMYEVEGTIYLYQMHGHILLNIVTQDKEVPHAVLVRAIEPEDGTELMFKNRQKHGVQLTNGPGKLTAAMGITMEYNGNHITEQPLYIDSTQKKIPKVIESSPRIGIPNKGEWTDKLLRYTVKGNPYLSKYKGITDKSNHGWQ